MHSNNPKVDTPMSHLYVTHVGPEKETMKFHKKPAYSLEVCTKMDSYNLGTALQTWMSSKSHMVAHKIHYSRRVEIQTQQVTMSSIIQLSSILQTRFSHQGSSELTPSNSKQNQLTSECRVHPYLA